MFAWTVIFCIMLWLILVMWSWVLSYAWLILRVPCLFTSVFLISIFLLYEILSSPRHLIFGMNLYRLFIYTQARKGIDQKVIELFIHTLLDIFRKQLILIPFLKLKIILNIPSRCKNPSLDPWILLNSLSNLLMLEIEGLNRTSYVIITSDSLLHVFFVEAVSFFDLLVLLSVGCGR